MSFYTLPGFTGDDGDDDAEDLFGMPPPYTDDEILVMAAEYHEPVTFASRAEADAAYNEAFARQAAITKAERQLDWYNTELALKQAS